MKNAIIDFETYYDSEVSVVHLGNPNYVAKADAYCVGVVIPEDGVAACGALKEMAPMMEQLVADPTIRPVAANSNFDKAWTEKYWSPFKQDWHCILDHATFHQFPRWLAGAVEAAMGIKMDKTTRDEMKGVQFDDLPAERQEEILQYCLNDCVQTAELLEKLPPMSPVEEDVAAHTRMINRRGVHINLALVEEDKTKLEVMRFEAFRAIPWHADDKPLSYQALVRYCQKNRLPVPKSVAKTDSDTTELIATCPELEVVIGAMRRFRRANTVLKKIEALCCRITPDGVLPLDFLYCGAPHTRRWSSKGFNVQNLDKEPLLIQQPGRDEPLSVWSRNWLIPPPGKKFLILDLAQIQPRGLNWAAGNMAMMEALKTGFSYYEAYARAANPRIAAGWSGKPGTIKLELGKARYTKLKNESLGLGFGMGAAHYTDYAGCDLREAEETVKSFREKNPLVVKFWRRLDNLIATAARDKSRHLAIQMPTGDYLNHFNIRVRGRSYESFTVKGDFGHNSHQPRLWGGTLAENIAQRIERDVIAEAVLRLEGAGFPVIFHSHDEVIVAVDENAGDETKHECERLMSISPEWAPDLPLGSEGDYTPCYTKF